MDATAARDRDVEPIDVDVRGNELYFSDGDGDQIFVLDKFSGKKIVPELKITLPGKAGAENEVDGVTGATLSSKAFERMINAQAKEYISLLREGS